MASAVTTFSWESAKNEILLNPRWPAEDRAFLQRSAEACLEERALTSHFVLSSSGTSAESWRAVKLIFIRKAAVLAAARAVIEFFELNEKDVFGQTLPEFHVGGLGNVARAYLARGSLAPVAGTGSWSAVAFHKAIAQEGVTVVSLVPAQLHDLLAAKLSAPPSLRIVFVGGAALSPFLETEAREKGWPIVATFGMTETSAMIAVRTEPDPHLGLRLLPHVEARAAAEGVLEVRAPSLATGSARLHGGSVVWADVTGPDGWFRSEDVVRETNQRWFIRGRGRDFAKIGGESVNAGALREIFARVLAERQIPEVHFHLLLRPHARLGHEVVLLCEKPELAADARAEYDRKVLPFERIREIIAWPRIPRTELGKVREEEIRRSMLDTAGRESREGSDA